MKFFVTGASGELGSALVKRLCEDGHEVVAYLRHSSKIPERLKDLPITIARGALLDSLGLKKWMKGCDGVFHVAGLISWQRKDRERLFRTNVDGTRSVVAMAKELKVPRVVVTSSVMAIGTPNRLTPVDETFSYPTEVAMSSYSLSKHDGQEAARALAEPGFDVVCVNPGVIIGPQSRLLAHARKHPSAYYLPGGICAVPLDAVVEGHLSAFAKGHSGECYILGGDNVSYQELLQFAAQAAGQAAPTRRMWPAILKLIAWCSETFAPRHKTPAMPLELARIVCGTHYFSSQKAIRELGWSWTPLETYLKDL